MMLNALLPVGSRRRTAAMTAIATGALLLLTQFGLPGSGGGRGTPGAILFLGSVSGLISALTAVGIILVFRTTRIINFAQAAIGSIGAVFTYYLTLVYDIPFLVTFVIGVMVGAASGALIEVAVVKRFFNAPRLLLTALTIALLSAIGLLIGLVAQFPIFGQADLTQAQRFGQERLKLPFDGLSFKIGTNALEFGFAELFAIGVSLAALAAIAYFLYRTRTGIAVRAASENMERASLLGIPIRSMSTVVWTVAGAVSAVGLILLGIISDFTSSGAGATASFVRSLAAAVLARMRSIPVAIAAAIGIEIAKEAVRWRYPERVELVDLALLVTIVVGLLVQWRQRVRGDEGESGTWQTIEEFRPVPSELRAIAGLRIARFVLMFVVLAGLLLVPWTFPLGGTTQATRLLIYTIVLLSLVVLTGWGGLVSLGQFGFVAIGAVVAGALSSRLGVTFWLAVPAAALFTALFAMILGLSALRIKGFYLGVVTLAFSAAIQAVLFKKQYFGWLLPERVDRPTLFFIDFEDERSMYYLVLAGLLIAVLMVSVLRRTRTGRITIGMRENEPNIESFGINLVRTRLAVFALSGFLAGYAGALLAHHQRAIDDSSYTAVLSLQFFVLAVVSGVGTVAGAIVGGAYLAIQSVVYLITGPLSVFIGIVFGPIGLLFILYMFPRGITSMLYALRDGILRIVAQRRQIVVPSLFADYDPRVVARRLVPLAEPELRSGLGAVPADRRYRRISVLYGRQLEEAGGIRGEEARALQAAVDAVGEGE